LLACFAGKKTAAKRQRGLAAELRSHGDHVLDTTVVEVDSNHKARVYDPHRVLAGALTSALTWGLFGLVTGGVASLVASAALGVAWGGWMARAHAHHATGAQLARAGAHLPADSSALLTFAQTTNTRSILAAARAHDATVVSVAAIADDLRARILTETEDDAVGAARKPDLSMVILRLHNRGAADQAVERIADTPATARLNVELLIDTDNSGRRHVVDPTLGAGAVARYNLRSWGVLGLICGALAGATGGGGLVGFLSGGILTAVAWGLFGLAAGALYGLWAGRAISARRLKGFAPMLAPDTSLIFAWADAPPTDETLASLTKDDDESLVIGFAPADGGAVLCVA
jgi:hypothetical protein